MPITPSLRRATLVLASVFVAACGKSTRPPLSAYDLELIWLGTEPSSDIRNSFDVASNSISQTIIGSLDQVSIPNFFTNLSSCGLPGYPDISRENINGLRIYAVVDSIDGPGGTLGSAGPCLIRNNDIPALGVMRFDIADVQNLLGTGRLPSVVLHEMLHVVGIGTVWFDLELLDTLTNPADARFLGVAARTQCATENGGASVCGTTVPAHSADGDGSRFSHWRESTFGSELMTPFLGAGAAPLSAMTVGSLEDLGYEVSYDAADPYTVPNTAALMADGPAPRGMRLSEPLLPRWKVDGAGRLVPVRPRR